MDGWDYLHVSSSHPHSQCLIHLINPEQRTMCLHREVIQINIDLYTYNRENAQLQSGLCGHLGLK